MVPEVRAQGLFRDRFIGVVRAGHPLREGEVTPARYSGGRHILVSRCGLDGGPIDEALERLGPEREVATIVGDLWQVSAFSRQVGDSVPSQLTNETPDAGTLARHR